jgi:hypothetical protein
VTLGGGEGGDGLLIGPFLQWWDKHVAKRDARRTARLEKRASRRGSRSKTRTKDASPQG